MVEHTSSSRSFRARPAPNSSRSSARSFKRPFYIRLPEQSRHLPHHDRAGAEFFDGKPQFLELGHAFAQSINGGFIQFNDFRDQEALALCAAVRERFLHALIDEPFMRRMLIDNHNACRRLGHDIGFVDLCPGRTQREVLRRRGVGL